LTERSTKKRVKDSCVFFAGHHHIGKGAYAVLTATPPCAATLTGECYQKVTRNRFVRKSLTLSGLGALIVNSIPFAKNLAAIGIPLAIQILCQSAWHTHCTMHTVPVTSEFGTPRATLRHSE